MASEVGIRLALRLLEFYDVVDAQWLTFDKPVVEVDYLPGRVTQKLSVDSKEVVDSGLFEARPG